MDIATTKELLLTAIEQDRADIAAQIDRIEIELTPLQDDEKISLPLEARYRKLTLEYFLQKNKAALKEIDDYVDVQLDNVCAVHAIEQAASRVPRFNLGHSSSDPLQRLTYTYRFRGHLTYNYDPDYLREIDFRFLSLPAPSYREIIGQIRAEYKKRHTSDDFNLVAEAYVELCTVPNLEQAYQTNHFIAKKSELVAHILERFQSRDYISLAHLLPSFIEGVFHDICVTIGLKTAKLEKASLTDALKNIQKIADPIGIEYLLFIFPLRRNRIAHGRDLGESYRHVALSFMLDLDLLLHIAKHRDIPLNELLDILQHPRVQNIKEIFRFPINELHERVASECFGLSDWFESDAFWVELERQVTSFDIVDKKTERFVKKLLSHSHLFSAPPATERIAERCKDFLRTVLPETRKRIADNESQIAIFLDRFKQQLKENKQ